MERPQSAQQHGDINKDKKKIKKVFRQEVNEEDVQKQIKDTLASLNLKRAKSKTSKYRREKRDAISQRQQKKQERTEMEKSILKVTEFVTVNELGSMMNVPATQLIATCMSLGFLFQSTKDSMQKQ